MNEITGSISMFFFSIQSYVLPINFVCLLVAFFGSLYVAIHARNIVCWIRTPLWYLGVACFLVAMSIVCEWTLGPTFVFSYSRFGNIGEMMINFFLAASAFLMFMQTIYQDIKSMKMRK
jgi:membrane-bound ClpP family serine protease